MTGITEATLVGRSTSWLENQRQLLNRKKTDFTNLANAATISDRQPLLAKASAVDEELAIVTHLLRLLAE